MITKEEIANKLRVLAMLYISDFKNLDINEYFLKIFGEYKKHIIASPTLEEAIEAKIFENNYDDLLSKIEDSTDPNCIIMAFVRYAFSSGGPIKAKLNLSDKTISKEWTKFVKIFLVYMESQ